MTNLMPAEQWLQDNPEVFVTELSANVIRQIQANALRYAADTDSESLREQANQLDPQA